MGWKFWEDNEKKAVTGSVVIPASPAEHNIYAGSVHKAFIPSYLYKPPYGYPRDQNITLLRKLGANGYVHSIISTIQYEVCGLDYDIVCRNGEELTDADLRDIEAVKAFLDNPNSLEQNFRDILRAVVKDVLELDSGVLVKVFNAKGRLTQLYAKDGGSFLKNTDIYGTFDTRSDYVNWHFFQQDPETGQYKPMVTRVDKVDNFVHYSERAAYFQYGNVYGGIPIPFGRREVIWFSQYPRTDSIYGRGPLDVLGDVLYTLIYGASANMDMYINNNIPEGVISVLDGNKDDIKAFGSRLKSTFYEKDVFDNDRRKFFAVPITNKEVKFTPLQLPAKELDIISQQQWFWKIVMACFGVTPSELGWTDDVNRATAANQTATFKRRAIQPLVQLIEDRLNNSLIPEFGNEKLMFKFNDYDLNEELKKHELYEKRLTLGISTINEVREEEGMEPLPGGDLSQYEQQQQMFGSPSEDENLSPPPPDEFSSADDSDPLDEADTKALASGVLTASVVRERLTRVANDPELSDLVPPSLRKMTTTYSKADWRKLGVRELRRILREVQRVQSDFRKIRRSVTAKSEMEAFPLTETEEAFENTLTQGLDNVWDEVTKIIKG